MPLDQSDLQKLNRWLAERGVNPICPSCGRNQWSVGDLIVAPSFREGNIDFGTQLIPMVPLICGNCAYVRMYAAVPIGITPKSG
jgi:hypothetical protein